MAREDERQSLRRHVDAVWKKSVAVKRRFVVDCVETISMPVPSKCGDSHSPSRVASLGRFGQLVKFLDGVGDVKDCDQRSKYMIRT